MQPIVYAQHWWLVVWCKKRGLVRVLHSLSACAIPEARAAVLRSVHELFVDYMPDAADVATICVPQEQKG